MRSDSSKCTLHILITLPKKIKGAKIYCFQAPFTFQWFCILKSIVANVMRRAVFWGVAHSRRSETKLYLLTISFITPLNLLLRLQLSSYNPQTLTSVCRSQAMESSCEQYAASSCLTDLSRSGIDNKCNSSWTKESEPWLLSLHISLVLFMFPVGRFSECCSLMLQLLPGVFRCLISAAALSMIAFGGCWPPLLIPHC